MAQENIIKTRLEEAANIDPLQNSASEELGELVKENTVFTYDTLQPQTQPPVELFDTLTVKGKGVENLDFALDKVNSNAWALLEEADKNGQLSMVFAVEKRGSKTPADVIYSIDYSELREAGITTVEKLTAYDRRVHLAVANLFNYIGEYMTVSQIYHSMGYNNRPNKRDIDKIYTSLRKMRYLKITLDNASEHDAFTSTKNGQRSSTRENFKYDGVLLPWEAVRKEVNGRLAEAVIHPFREPPLMAFARGRNQITKISRKLLEVPLSMTEKNLRMTDYLIERISHAKRGNLSNKILYSTIFEKAEITAKKQRSRAKDDIDKILDYWKRIDYIKDFERVKDGVIVYVNTQ